LHAQADSVCSIVGFGNIGVDCRIHGSSKDPQSLCRQ
jgi:hypothetical protein